MPSQTAGVLYAELANMVIGFTKWKCVKIKSFLILIYRSVCVFFFGVARLETLYAVLRSVLFVW